MLNQNIKSNGMLVAALFLTTLLLVHPVRALIADYSYGSVETLLDDPATEVRDTLDISAETMPAYLHAIDALEKTAALVPSKALYHKALSALYFRIGAWTDDMEGFGEPLPAGALAKNAAFQKAWECLSAAVGLEPLNPDYHLALGRLTEAMGLPSSSREYEAAAQIAPHNAGLRYAVAMRYLLSGRKAEALKHAEALAAMDDSYLVPESSAKQLTLERRTPAYLSAVTNSYLMKALELGWRASNKDIGIVRNMVPTGEEAWEVWRLFRERQGLDG